ncbi:MAG: hypothetical protein ACREUO_02365 [Burkholderiales bacterium]
MKFIRLGAVLSCVSADNAIAIGSTPAEFADHIRKEQTRWSDVVKRAKIQAE